MFTFRISVVFILSRILSRFSEQYDDDGRRVIKGSHCCSFTTVVLDGHILLFGTERVHLGDFMPVPASI